MYKFITTLLVCAFLVNDVSWAMPSGYDRPQQSTLATQSAFNRITQFLETNQLDIKEKACLVYSAAELKKVFIDKKFNPIETPRAINHLNDMISEKFPESNIRIEEGVKERELAGDAYRYVVMNLGNGQAVEAFFPKVCAGLESVWFVSEQNYSLTGSASDAARRPSLRVNYDIDRQRAEQWIAAHPTENLRKVARFMVDNITHVTQHEFEDALQEAVTDFNRSFDRPYVAVLHEMSGSGPWALAIAMEKGLQPPSAVVNELDLDEYISRHPNTTDFMILDDAAYTGSQISGIVLHIDESMSKHASSKAIIHVVVPFMSEFAQDWITEFKPLSIIFYKHRIIDNISAIAVKADFNHDECFDLLQRWLEFCTTGNPTYTGTGIDQLTLTYFDHKVPDEVSFPMAVKEGMVYNENSNLVTADLPFMPQIISPYNEASKTQPSQLPTAFPHSQQQMGQAGAVATKPAAQTAIAGPANTVSDCERWIADACNRDMDSPEYSTAVLALTRLVRRIGAKDGPAGIELLNKIIAGLSRDCMIRIQAIRKLEEVGGKPGDLKGAADDAGKFMPNIHRMPDRFLGEFGDSNSAFLNALNDDAIKKSARIRKVIMELNEIRKALHITVKEFGEEVDPAHPRSVAAMEQILYGGIGVSEDAISKTLAGAKKAYARIAPGKLTAIRRICCMEEDAAGFARLLKIEPGDTKSNISDMLEEMEGGTRDISYEVMKRAMHLYDCEKGESYVSEGFPSLCEELGVNVRRFSKELRKGMKLWQRLTPEYVIFVADRIAPDSKAKSLYREDAFSNREARAKELRDIQEALDLSRKKIGDIAGLSKPIIDQIWVGNRFVESDRFAQAKKFYKENAPSRLNAIRRILCINEEDFTGLINEGLEADQKCTGLQITEMEAKRIDIPYAVMRRATDLYKKEKTGRYEKGGFKALRKKLGVGMANFTVELRRDKRIHKRLTPEYIISVADRIAAEKRIVPVALQAEGSQDKSGDISWGGIGVGGLIMHIRWNRDPDEIAKLAMKDIEENIFTAGDFVTALNDLARDTKYTEACGRIKRAILTGHLSDHSQGSPATVKAVPLAPEVKVSPAAVSGSSRFVPGTIFDEDFIREERDISRRYKTIVFDMDETIIGESGDSIEGMVEQLEKLHKTPGVRLVLWTSALKAGVDRFIEKCPRAAACFSRFIAFEDYCLDLHVALPILLEAHGIYVSEQEILNNPDSPDVLTAFKIEGWYAKYGSMAKEINLLGYDLLVDDAIKAISMAESAPLGPFKHYRFMGGEQVPNLVDALLQLLDIPQNHSLTGSVSVAGRNPVIPEPGSGIMTRRASEILKELSPEDVEGIQVMAAGIHRKNLEYVKYVPAPSERTILCHITADSILPVAQKAEGFLNRLDVAMRDKSYGTEKVLELRVDSSKDFIQQVREKKRQAEDLYTREYGDEYKNYKFEFDVACSNTSDVARVQKELGLPALAFKPCEEPAQFEGVVLALRALSSGDIGRLKEVYRLLSGKDLVEDTSDINEFARIVTFILPTAKILDNEVRRFNKTISDNIRSAA